MFYNISFCTLAHFHLHTRNSMQSHIDQDGRDKNWLEPGWMASRCAGICDDELAMCW